MSVTQQTNRMLTMPMMTVTNAPSNANNNNNANTAAPLAEEEEEEEEESDCTMSMCSEEEDEEEESDGEELDAASVYVSLFAVADRMERWYASGARECPEDHVLRVEALLRREPAVTNVFETREAVDGPNVGGLVTADGRFRQLAERLEAENARPRGDDRGPARAGGGDRAAHRVREAHAPGRASVGAPRELRLVGAGAPEKRTNRCVFDPRE